jgi:hypothetical protein
VIPGDFSTWIGTENMSISPGMLPAKRRLASSMGKRDIIPQEFLPRMKIKSHQRNIQADRKDN